MAGASAGKWIIRIKARENPQHRLICFPHAGGSASFFSGWANMFSETTEVCAVQFPGRQQRMAEVPYRRMAPAIESLAESLQPMLNRRTLGIATLPTSQASRHTDAIPLMGR